MNRIAQQDDQAARRLYGYYQPQLFGYIRFRVWNDMAAEEITLDTLFIAFDKSAAYNGLSEFSTWLCGIANKRILQWRHSQALAPQTVELDDEELDDARGGEWDVLARFEHDEALQGILLCMDKLPDGQREALYWTAIEELSLAETSQRMEVAEGTLKSRLFHARQRIRNCLARAFGAEYPGVQHG
ncbi:RNA polymerase sigma factor [Duganella fentianensis]|uniref:RNA polymerase sigma factor n=1 Tax=Duganella fentianensis TaxID=2692177 RepID=UPI0032B292A6